MIAWLSPLAHALGWFSLTMLAAAIATVLVLLIVSLLGGLAQTLLDHHEHPVTVRNRSMDSFTGRRR